MEDVRKDGRPIMRVVVKVRFAPFITKQHGRKLPEPTLDQAVIDRQAQDLLAMFEERPIRLLGVRAEFDREPSSGA
jgi:DNA polymerase-4